MSFCSDREAVCEAVAIEKVARKYTTLEPFGGDGWFNGPCPLHDHDDKDRSIYITPAGRWQCQGYGQAGDVVELEFLCGNYTSPSEALLALAIEHDVELPQARNGTALENRSVGTLLCEVRPEKIRWLWPGRIPYGKLTIVDGDPGTGKSAMTTDLAARVSAGRDLPDGTSCEPSGVVLLNAEDGLADTIRPRLEAAGADLGRVLALATVADADGSERLLSIPEDLDTIRCGIARVNAGLIIIDPMMAFVSGSINTH